MSLLEIKHIYPPTFPLPLHVPNGSETARRHQWSGSLALSSHHRLQHSACLPGSYLPLLHCIGLEKIAHGQHMCMHVLLEHAAGNPGIICWALGWKWYGYFPTVFEFDPVWKCFYSSVSDSEYLLSVTDPYPNAQKLHFYDVDIHYNLIRQKLTISVSDSVFEHKYENKYDISDIRPYPIRFHP